MGAPDFNKQFWRLVSPRPEFRIQNVFNDRFIAVVQDPGNADNWLVVGFDEGSLVRMHYDSNVLPMLIDMRVVLVPVCEPGSSDSLHCRISGLSYDRCSN